MTTDTGQRQTWFPPVLTPWQRLKRSPAFTLAQYLYQRRAPIAPPPTPQPSSLPVSIVCMSDTHTTQPAVPDGDLLLHAGDLTNTGSFEELQAQISWLASLSHEHKVVVAGNHDVLLDPAYVDRFPDRICEGRGTARGDLDWGGVTYLDDSSARLRFRSGREMAVYGSPWTPLCGTFAFQYPEVRAVWEDRIPPGTEVLLTHGPPRGHLDDGGKGCPQLLREIWRARPRLVVFGHIHTGHGVEHLEYDGILGAYDGVMAGERGLLAVVSMACRLVGERLCNALFRRRTRKRCGTLRGTTLVNAAAVAGRMNEVRQPAIVVSI